MGALDLFVIQARYPGELYDIREWVQPGTASVRLLYAELVRPGMGEDARLSALLEWVVANVEYPMTDSGEQTDYHRMVAYETRRNGAVHTHVVLEARDDFWEFPAEVLATKMADCDGRASLLASLLRQFLPAERVRVAIGELAGYGGHAWVRVQRADGRWYIQDPSALVVPDPPFMPAAEAEGVYQELFRFNDVEYGGQWVPLIPHVPAAAKLAGLNEVWGCRVCTR